MAVRVSRTTAGFLILGSAVPLVAHSQVYFTEAEAAKAIAPAASFVRKTIELTPADVKKIESLSGETVRNRTVVAFVDAAKNAVFIDQVLGKHEFITYAVGVSAAAKVTGVEIVEYRETYGQKVREAAWRKQFVDKTSAAPLKLNRDIVNLSGATLSSSHVTGGVRRMLRTYEVISARL